MTLSRATIALALATIAVVACAALAYHAGMGVP
jgi:hypothetical protein